MKAYFVFDVESVGLHGEGFAVAGGIYLANGAVQREFRYACPSEQAEGVEEDREWVNKNVPVLEITHRTPMGVRSAFWVEWMNAKGVCDCMAVECGWPVEARFLAACIDDNPAERRWKGPYPLMEIASFMAAARMDVMKKYERTPSELPEHDPLADARLSARLLSIALQILGQQE